MKIALRILGIVAALVAAAVPMYLFGVAGWRQGFLAVAVALVAIAFGGGALLLREVPGRGPYTGAAVLLAVVVAAQLTELAPPSAGVLTATLDDLPLAFYEMTGEQRSGNGRCQPTCPVVRRTYLGPTIGEDAAQDEVDLAVRSLGERRNIRITARATLDVGDDPGPADDRLTVRITARSRRGS